MPSSFHIILVDDDTYVRLALARYLQRAFPAATVSPASSGERAIELYDTQGADALVIDQHMPGGMSGVDVIRSLRARNVTIPIIMLSADISTEREALAAGATRFMMKGGSLDALIAALQAELQGGA